MIYSYQNSTNLNSNLCDILCDIPFIPVRGKGKISNIPCAFDIEASSFYDGEDKKCCMYAWVFGINGKCILGRTWQEFMGIIDELVKCYDLSLKKRLIIYVHNLSYEFQFFMKYFEWDKVFSIEPRKPIYAITKNGIEFRCSYLLSGYSLKVLGDNLLKYKVEKKVGDLDYKLIRHSETPLTDKEKGYILNDCLVVMSYIQEEIERLGSLKELPITKTGYVRNLCKEKCLKGEGRYDYNRLMKSLTLEPNEYRELKRCFMGGFTHANVTYANKTIKNVSSFDFTSSYPAVMLAEKYPMTAPFKVILKNDEDFIKRLKTCCCMFDCTFYGIEAKVEFENYISFSRCRNIDDYYTNNGRVVEALQLTITLTEQDFFIISNLYAWKSIEVSNFYCFYKDYLPKEIIETILDLYKDKTELKGVEDKQVEYMVAKNMINSMYGMCVTDICRKEIIYDNGWQQSPEPNIEELIEKYNHNPQRFLYYAWGVWVTAYARRNLFTGILEFKDDYIYSDTDSLKVLHKENHMKYIEEYNEKIKKKIELCLKHYGIPISRAYPKTKKGIVKPLGVWDYEGDYTRFKTLGAKRYIVEKDGELEITIAGVAKEAGKKYLLHTYKTIDNVFKNFEEDLVFPANYECDGKEECGSGKMLHTYIDDVMKGEVIDYMGNKYEYTELSGMHLENTSYELSLDADFVKLILGYKESHLV